MPILESLRIIWFYCCWLFLLRLQVVFIRRRSQSRSRHTVALFFFSLLHELRLEYGANARIFCIRCHRKIDLCLLIVYTFRKTHRIITLLCVYTRITWPVHKNFISCIGNPIKWFIAMVLLPSFFFSFQFNRIGKLLWSFSLQFS